MIKHPRLLLHGFALTFLMTGLLMVFGGSKAFAIQENTSNIPPSIVGIFNADQNCGGNAQAQYVWGSVAGDNASSTIEIPYGTNSVSIWMNSTATNCASAFDGNGNIVDTNLIRTRSTITSAIVDKSLPNPSPGDVSGYGPGAVDVTYSNSYPNNQRWVKDGSDRPWIQTINITNLASTKPGSYKIKIKTKERPVNEFASPAHYQCVQNGSQQADSLEDPKCLEWENDLEVTVNVKETPLGAIDGAATCDGMRGWAYDISNFAVHPALDVYFDLGKPTQRGVHLTAKAPDNTDPGFNSGQYKVVPRPDVKAANNLPTDMVGWEIGGEYMPIDTGVVHTIDIAMIGIDAAGNPNGENIWIPTQKTVKNCDVPECSAVIITDQSNQQILGGTFEPPRTVSLTFGGEGKYEPGADGFYTLFFTGTSGTSQLQTGNVTYDANTNKTTISNVALNTAGTYTLHWVYKWVEDGNVRVAKEKDGSGVCKNPFTLANKPYAKVFGNDIGAGAKFAPTATPTECPAGKPTGTTSSGTAIWAFNKKVVNGASSYYGGASSQFAAVSLNKNTEFSTASQHNPEVNGQATPNVGMTFGNMVNPTSGTVTDDGGNSPIWRCIPNYYSAHTVATTSVGPYTPNFFGATYTQGVGTQVARFVDGDAYIFGNIVYAGADDGSWKKVSDIPNYYLIVKGDIYIDRNVTNMSGTFVAQPLDDNSKGRIFTCTNGGSLWDKSQLYANCDKQLTVTGSFIARQVWYQRTKGTVKGSIPDAPVAPAQLTMTWSSAGGVGAQCMFMSEAASISWDDNFLCTNRSDLYWVYLPQSIILPNPGFKHNATDQCFSWSSQHYDDAAWQDNAICWPASSPNPQFSWSATNDGSKSCTNITEIEDTRWKTGSSWLCVPKLAVPAYPAVGQTVNELPSSANIAEVFNFSQESYLAPLPAVLVPLLGTSSSGNNKPYDAITSLPPIL